MKRISDKMNEHTTARAAKLIGGDEDIEWADISTPGLSIRIRRESAVWSLRGRLLKKQTVRAIGPVGLVTWTEARARALEAAALMKRGIDPAPTLAEKLSGGKTEATGDPAIDGLTWPDARDKFLDFIKKHRSKKTYDDYENTLTSKRGDFDTWEKKLLKTFVKTDIQAMQERIFERSVSQAHKALRVVRSAFTWLSDQSWSGIDVSPARDVKPIDAGRLAKNAEGTKLGRTMTPDQVGLLLWRLADYTEPPQARLAATLMLLMAQRIETVLSATKTEFDALLDGGKWDIPAAHMKSKREHVLPMPRLACHVYLQARALSSPTSKLLFPQLRERRAGGGKENHLSYGVVRRAMGKLAMPHDDRRTFATHGETVLGWALPDISAILDHAEGRSGSVTAERYALGQRTHFKWHLLTRWEGWVLEQAARMAPKGRGPIPEYLVIPEAPPVPGRKLTMLQQVNGLFPDRPVF